MILNTKTKLITTSLNKNINNNDKRFMHSGDVQPPVPVVVDKIKCYDYIVKGLENGQTFGEILYYSNTVLGHVLDLNLFLDYVVDITKDYTQEQFSEVLSIKDDLHIFDKDTLNLLPNYEEIYMGPATDKLFNKITGHQIGLEKGAEVIQRSFMASHEATIDKYPLIERENALYIFSHRDLRHPMEHLKKPALDMIYYVEDMANKGHSFSEIIIKSKETLGVNMEKESFTTAIISWKNINKIDNSVISTLDDLNIFDNGNLVNNWKTIYDSALTKKLESEKADTFINIYHDTSSKASYAPNSPSSSNGENMLEDYGLLNNGNNNSIILLTAAAYIMIAGLAWYFKDKDHKSVVTTDQPLDNDNLHSIYETSYNLSMIKNLLLVLLVPSIILILYNFRYYYYYHYYYKTLLTLTASTTNKSINKGILGMSNNRSCTSLIKNNNNHDKRFMHSGDRVPLTDKELRCYDYIANALNNKQTFSEILYFSSRYLGEPLDLNFFIDIINHMQTHNYDNNNDRYNFLRQRDDLNLFNIDTLQVHPNFHAIYRGPETAKIFDQITAEWLVEQEAEAVIKRAINITKGIPIPIQENNENPLSNALYIYSRRDKMDSSKDYLEKPALDMIHYVEDMVNKKHTFSEIIINSKEALGVYIQSESFSTAIITLKRYHKIDNDILHTLDDLNIFNNGVLVNNWKNIYNSVAIPRSNELNALKSEKTDTFINIYHDNSFNASSSSNSSSNNSSKGEDIFQDYGLFNNGNNNSIIFLTVAAYIMIVGLAWFYKDKDNKSVVTTEQPVDNDNLHSIYETSHNLSMIKNLLLVLLVPSIILILYNFRYYYYYKTLLTFTASTHKNINNKPKT